MRIRRIGAVEDEVGLVVHQALERSADRFVFQVKSCPSVFNEEAAEQAEDSRARTHIADHHPQDGLFSTRQLLRVGSQVLEILKRQSCPGVKHTAGIRQAHSVATAIEEGDAQLLLEAGDGGED